MEITAQSFIADEGENIKTYLSEALKNASKARYLKMLTLQEGASGIDIE